MTQLIQPTTFAEIADLVASSARVLPVGAQTKSALGAASQMSRNNASEVTLIDLRGHAGIVTYDPSEFLISARAGTTINDLARVLAEHGQYLPFDPVLAEQGATLGGSIASGISGPCRLLYGGLRDFMLEVQLCDSAGREVRGGGKVVKNAAGFDLPKLVIGSYGRLGIITEATLKVFPKPAGTMTISVACSSLRAALDRGLKLLSLPLPIAALEIDYGHTLLVRLAGPIDSLAAMADRVTQTLPHGQPVQRLAHGDIESALWHDLAEFKWAEDCQALVRVAITHHQCSELVKGLQALGDACETMISCGASVAWIGLRELDGLGPLDQLLRDQAISAVVVRGSDGLTLLGDSRWVVAAQRIQAAMDPGKKYIEYPGTR